MKDNGHNGIIEKTANMEERIMKTICEEAYEEWQHGKMNMKNEQWRNQ